MQRRDGCHSWRTNTCFRHLRVLQTVISIIKFWMWYCEALAYQWCSPLVFGLGLHTPLGLRYKSSNIHGTCLGLGEEVESSGLFLSYAMSLCRVSGLCCIPNCSTCSSLSTSAGHLPALCWERASAHKPHHPPMWNVYDRGMDIRTNNSVERCDVFTIFTAHNVLHTVLLSFQWRQVCHCLESSSK